MRLVEEPSTNLTPSASKVFGESGVELYCSSSGSPFFDPNHAEIAVR